MSGWLLQNLDVVGTMLDALTVSVWVVYLQLILLSFVRQRKSVILIHMSVARSTRARCLVTNMGSEPIYLLAVLMELRNGEDSYIALVTERDELNAEDLRQPSEATNQGPLSSGEFRDIGDFGTLEKRARRHAVKTVPPEDPQDVTLYIVAVSGHAARMVGCCQTFQLDRSDGEVSYNPQTLIAKQISNMRHPRWRHILDLLH